MILKGKIRFKDIHYKKWYEPLNLEISNPCAELLMDMDYQAMYAHCIAGMPIAGMPINSIEEAKRLADIRGYNIADLRATQVFHDEIENQIHKWDIQDIVKLWEATGQLIYDTNR